MIYYDSLSHEVNIGSIVAFTTLGYLLYGTIKNVKEKENGTYKFIIEPNIGVPQDFRDKVKKQYTITSLNTYLISIKKKGE